MSSKKGWEIKASYPSRPNRFGTPNSVKETQYHYITNVLSRNAEILRLCFSLIAIFHFQYFAVAAAEIDRNKAKL